MDPYATELRNRRDDVETIVSESDVAFADFFNRPAFFRYHVDASKAKGFYFQLVGKETKRALAVAHFTEKEPGFFASPFRGTYAGIDTKEHDIALYDMFLDDIEKHLKKAGAKTMQLALAPEAHDPARHHLMLNALLRHGFSIAKQDINYDLAVDATPLIEKMERNNQKRVRKCRREGCEFFRFEKPQEIEQVYAVIKKNREAKGYPVTMTLEHMLEMKKLFPDVWNFFGTKLKGELIAASVCIRINPEILYVFYWGDLPEAHALSPVAFHADNLYEVCREWGVRILDIGTSTDNGVPNLGLMKFKERLGCTSSMKFVFAKAL